MRYIVAFIVLLISPIANAEWYVFSMKEPIPMLFMVDGTEPTNDDFNQPQMTFLCQQQKIYMGVLSPGSTLSTTHKYMHAYTYRVDNGPPVSGFALSPHEGDAMLLLFQDDADKFLRKALAAQAVEISVFDEDTSKTFTHTHNLAKFTTTFRKFREQCTEVVH